MDCSLPGSSVHEIFQARVWSGLPCPLPGDLPDSGIEPVSFMSPERAGRFFTISVTWASLVAQTLKNLPTMQETWVQSLGQEHPLEKGMATYSSVLAWESSWTEGPGGLQSIGSTELVTTE